MTRLALKGKTRKKSLTTACCKSKMILSCLLSAKPFLREQFCIKLVKRHDVSTWITSLIAFLENKAVYRNKVCREKTFRENFRLNFFSPNFSNNLFSFKKEMLLFSLKISSKAFFRKNRIKFLIFFFFITWNN